MPANQYIPQGVLNRLKTSVQIDSFPALNVTPPYLGKRSVQITRNGRAVENFGTLTGIVPSPEPYQMFELRINLLKTQGLSDDYEQQLQANAVLGTVTVRTDTSTLRSFQMYQVSIVNVDPLSFAGDSPDYIAVLEGMYVINSVLWG